MLAVPLPEALEGDGPVPVRATIIGGSLVYEGKQLERAGPANRPSIHSTRAGRSRTSSTAVAGPHHPAPGAGGFHRDRRRRRRPFSGPGP